MAQIAFVRYARGGDGSPGPLPRLSEVQQAIAVDYVRRDYQPAGGSLGPSRTLDVFSSYAPPQAGGVVDGQIVLQEPAIGRAQGYARWFLGSLRQAANWQDSSYPPANMVLLPYGAMLNRTSTVTIARPLREGDYMLGYRQNPSMPEYGSSASPLGYE